MYEVDSAISGASTSTAENRVIRNQLPAVVVRINEKRCVEVDGK
jgi:hypothetical protein